MQPYFKLSRRIIQSKARLWEEEQFSIECHKTNDSAYMYLSCCSLANQNKKPFSLPSSSKVKRLFEILTFITTSQEKFFFPCCTRFQ